MKYFTKMHLICIQQYIRKTVTKPQYEVEVIIEEKNVGIFADTGAGICVTSKKKAKKIGFTIWRNKYENTPLWLTLNEMLWLLFRNHYVWRHCGLCMLCIYVVEPDRETLLSRTEAEELRIITFNPSDDNQKQAIRRSTASNNSAKAHFILKYPEVFSGVGTLKGHQIKLYIDESVPPVAAPYRPGAFHLRKRFEKEIE